MMAPEDALPQTSHTFAGLPSHETDICTARFVVVPVPYEATTEWLPGTRLGPAAIIDSSPLLELYDHELDFDVSRLGIVTAAEVPPVLSGPEHEVAAVESEVGSWLDRGKTPVLLGGEHTITVGAVAAAAARFPRLSVLQLDAHADLRDEYLGARWSQATVMRRVLDVCPSIAQAGVRSLSMEEMHFIRERRLSVAFWPPDSDPWASSLIDGLQQDVYVSIDADVFDSSLLPWVGTPEPDGPGWRDVLTLLRQVAQKRNVVGFDVVEFSPYGPGAAASAYLLAKLIYRFIGYIGMAHAGGNKR
jgi:agmatinase